MNKQLIEFLNFQKINIDFFKNESLNNIYIVNSNNSNTFNIDFNEQLTDITLIKDINNNLYEKLNIDKFIGGIYFSIGKIFYKNKLNTFDFGCLINFTNDNYYYFVNNMFNKITGIELIYIQNFKELLLATK